MTESRQRIDKWLFFARIVKSRSLAAKLAQAGRVRINGDKIDQPSRMVVPDDVLTIALDRKVLVLKVLQPGTRRRPYAEARLLYEDQSPPPAARERGLAALPPYREAGSGRPTKRERRQLDKWKSAGD
ncbi:RNA-binding S4 domain-containing protein [Nitratireductor sp. XY-223]|uniref:RNA-binding S4 domain-containing protein n=1 Tax=Nitratireductor sp. XY-223 TaxID=2561926 RepID=UPI0010AA3A37|nr:RNA-binding S4 domain-containing protein [Nitratireductor sp. XY-223]